MIAAIEELSLNAWPSYQTLLYDGWIIRFANGYTKRANSVIPLYPSSIVLDEKLAFCENIYQRQKLDVVFKLTPAVCPGNLDDYLSARGYRKDSPTSVQVLDLETTKVELAHEADLLENLSDEWLDAFCQMSAVGEPRRETIRHILLNIVPQHCFVSLKLGDNFVACGLGVLQMGYVGLFDIVTDEPFRSRGYGRQVVESILLWGKQNGARRSYLQVMLNNSAALHLYSQVGYVEKYQYWYRIKP
ncbi:MAG: GNAT family N-acetyltransferase [Anaerolineales bacterium]|nr:GNAT family N-acetyltransferase [Anaerolineales bacterium]